MRKLLFLVLLIPMPWELSTAAEKPNIIVIVADDLGYADVGFRGSPIETPSLDRLAAEGLELSRFYTTPICSPTRAALMTGRDSVRMGVALSVIMPWDNIGVHTSERFMSEAFRDAGYQTAIMGKWHLGHSQQSFHPNNRGFDHFYGHLHTEVGFYPPFANLGGKDFQRNGKSIDDQGYETYLLADETTKFLRGRDKKRPFFLYLPFLAPHEPLDAPEELKQKYADLPDERAPARSPSDAMSERAIELGYPSRLPLYAAVVDAMDQAIGQVLDALDDEGLAENTIVMFFSDNGASRVWTQGGGNNAPLRGGKAETYEGGIRVVSLLRWPANIKAGGKFEKVMTVMDVFPTLAAAANVEPGNKWAFDGRNMLPALLEGEDVKQDGFIHFGSEIPIYGSMNFTAFDQNWKLVQWLEQDLTEISIRNELYNIEHDPGETNNVASMYPERVSIMAESIRKWRSLHPVNGVRGKVSAPPGWRAPLDWANYPRPIDQLQEKPAYGFVPDLKTLYRLDAGHGERGRMVYNCEPVSVEEGICKLK